MVTSLYSPGLDRVHFRSRGVGRKLEISGMCAFSSRKYEYKILQLVVLASPSQLVKYQPFDASPVETRARRRD
jgi:hypothetical protein